jgi:flagellar hook protein FlgE
MQIPANPFSNGSSAVQAGRQRVERAADEIAGRSLPRGNGVEESSPPVGENGELARSLVDLQAGRQAVQVGAKVIETADEALGTLIDTRA